MGQRFVLWERKESELEIVVSLRISSLNALRLLQGFGLGFGVQRLGDLELTSVEMLKVCRPERKEVQAT